MKRNVVRAVTARLAASLVALLVLTVAPATAGDRAELNVLGFSPDSKYLAFEEFGVFDGSGGNYSHIFVVDLREDSWVPGTPFSIETNGDGGGDSASLAEIRSKAAAKAAPLLKKLEIEIPASVLVMLADGVANADGKSMVVDQPACCGPMDVDTSTEVKLSLKTFPAKMSGECMVDTAVGYELTASFVDGTISGLHKDGDTLPKSRSCPQDYRLYAVIAPYADGAPRVAIISSYPFDFEGTSRRFLAVPIDGWTPPENAD